MIRLGLALGCAVTAASLLLVVVDLAVAAFWPGRTPAFDLLVAP